MEQERWESMPATNNAEESMHWSLYRAVGKELPTLIGLERLIAWLDGFERKHQLQIGKSSSYSPKCPI